MKRYNIPDINTKEYWDSHQTSINDFGLRQEKYKELAGTGFSIIEVGCGLSAFLNGVKNNFVITVGLDYSPKTIAGAKELYPDVIYVEGDANNLSHYTPFEVVVAGEVIEHLQDPDRFLKELETMAYRRVIVSTPQLEFNDPEHLWEFDEDYFIKKGFKTEIVHSDRFKGRSYIFAWKDL